MLQYANLVAILPTLPRIALAGPWYRAVAFDYLQGPQAAFNAGGIAGLTYESTKSSTNGKGILVFTDRLAAAGSYMELYNEPVGKLQQRIP